MDSFGGETQDSSFRTKRKHESDSEMCQEPIVTWYELQHHPCDLRNATFICLDLGSDPEMSVINQALWTLLLSSDIPGRPAKKGLVSEVRPDSSPRASCMHRSPDPGAFQPQVSSIRSEDTHWNPPPGSLSGSQGSHVLPWACAPPGLSASASFLLGSTPKCSHGWGLSKTSEVLYSYCDLKWKHYETKTAQNLCHKPLT